MTAHEVLPELAEVISLVTGRDPSEVQPDRLFVDELRVDSLAMVEILEGTSRRLAVRIDDEDVKQFVRVRDLTSYVEARLT